MVGREPGDQQANLGSTTNEQGHPYVSDFCAIKWMYFPPCGQHRNVLGMTVRYLLKSSPSVIREVMISSLCIISYHCTLAAKSSENSLKTWWVQIKRNKEGHVLKKRGTKKDRTGLLTAPALPLGGMAPRNPCSSQDSSCLWQHRPRIICLIITT